VQRIWRSGEDYLVEVDGAFCLVDRTGAIVMRYESVDATALRDLRLDETSDTRAFIAEVFGDAEVAREAARLKHAREGEARVAAIAGARRDHGMGAGFARAQEALVAHVREYDDPLYSALLQTLIALARAKAHAAISEYVRACLLACFAHRIPEPSTGDPVKLPTLADELLARARDLDNRADGQEAADANNNARQFRAAADAVRLAASLLR
jgi:hypothetical protein